MQTNIASPGISSKGKSLFGISLTAALAGFIFGFDTVVISGADKPIQDLWHTSPWFHGFFIMSMALWGTVVGALAGGIPTQKYGRKKSIDLDRHFIYNFFNRFCICHRALYVFFLSFYWRPGYWRFFCSSTNIHFRNIYSPLKR